MAGLVHVEVQTIDEPLGNRAVGTVDVHAPKGVRRQLAHGGKALLVIANRLVRLEIGIARNHVDGIELAKMPHDALDMGADLVERHDGRAELLRDHRPPRTRDVVAPQQDERRADTILDRHPAHLSGALPIRLVGGRPVEHRPVLAGVRVDAEVRATAIPLRKRVDLQHVDALLRSTREVVLPIGQFDAGKGAPARIRQPKPRLPVEREAVLAVIHRELAKSHAIPFSSRPVPVVELSDSRFDNESPAGRMPSGALSQCRRAAGAISTYSEMRVTR